MAAKWKEDVTHRQQWLSDLLCGVDYCNYDVSRRDGKVILYRNVGFAYFDVPMEEPNDVNENTGYGGSQLETIKKTSKVILEINGNRSNLLMGVVFVFVHCEGDNVYRCPVFRVRTQEKKLFVGSDFRSYSSWEDYLDNNELPAGDLCWPEGGCYSVDADGKVRLGWGLTPAAKPHSKVLNGLDKLSLGTSIGSTLVFGASILTLPVAAPVMAAAGAAAAVTGVYSAARGVGTLVDRGSHGQTINPIEDRSAASSWLGVVGSAVGVGAGAMASRAANMARAGEVMGTVSSAALNALSATSLLVNGVGIVHGAVFLKERYDAKELTALDVFQFSASLLFFAHATVNFETASSIMTRTQKETMTDFENSLRSNRHRKQYRRLVKDTTKGMDTVEGNAKVIRSINNISNKDDFFAGMVRTRKDFKGKTVVFSENGNIIVGGKAEVHPMDLYNMGKQQRKAFIASAKNASRGSVSTKAYNDSLETLRSSLESSSTSLCTGIEMENALVAAVQWEIPNVSIEWQDVMLLVSVVDELTTLAMPFLENTQAKVWLVIWKHILKNVKDLEATYQEVKKIAMEVERVFNEREFDLQNGIYMTSRVSQFIVNELMRYSINIEMLLADIAKALATN